MLSFIFGVIVGLSSSDNSEHLCFANSVKDDSNGTYAWSKSRMTAIKLSLQLCEEKYGPCKIEYCEVYFEKARTEQIPPDWFCKADSSINKCFTVALASTKVKARKDALQDCKELCKGSCVVVECRKLEKE